MKKISHAILVLGALMLFAGCFSTSTPQSAPPVTARTGEMPTAVMLPIINTYEQPTADYVSQYLEACLGDRKVFNFVSKADMNQAIVGVDLDKMFGLKASQYAAIGQKLGVDYVIHGVMVVKKQLTFTGWRKDVDISTRIYNGKTGSKVDSWRSMTDFTWADGKSALDAEKMAESAANHTCAKMMERTY